MERAHTSDTTSVDTTDARQRWRVPPHPRCACGTRPLRHYAALYSGLEVHTVCFGLSHVLFPDPIHPARMRRWLRHDQPVHVHVLSDGCHAAQQLFEGARCGARSSIPPWTVFPKKEVDTVLLGLRGEVDRGVPCPPHQCTVRPTKSVPRRSVSFDRRTMSCLHGIDAMAIGESIPVDSGRVRT